ncbi:MAG: filamentous hemagglutinin N-terminal domain-containing protein [Verrucomicrobiota bacterium]|jgi:filamentous hemagglutinin family protein
MAVLMAVLLGQVLALRVGANPVRATVTQGSAVVSSQGPNLTVQTSGNAVINWGSFNIAAGETTTFVEPSATSVVWNNISGSSASQILGHLNANGYVILQNPAGFYVGGQAAIRAAGVIMTTAPAVTPDISGGSMWQFNAPPPSAAIINYGQISAGPAGPVFLIAHDVENHGAISAPGGNIGLYAGQQVMVSSRPDGRGLSAMVTLPQGSVNNAGQLIADAGTIALQAQVVNQGGMIQANSVRAQNGVIELVAGEDLTLGASSVIQANGGAQGASPGGSVTLQSGNQFHDASTSTISVAGGAQGGAGGVVEISAPVMPAINSRIDGHANAGSPGGGLMIDPVNIILGNSGTGSAGSGTVASGSPPNTLNLNVNSAFTGFSQIDLQAKGNITLSDGVTWDLAASTGVSTSGSQLTLEAGGNILIGTSRGANLTADTGWSVTLEAGRDFSVANTVVPGQPGTAAAGTVKSGTGNITLAGSATLEAQDGSISLLAGNSVTVATGAIRTMDGGNIDVEALAGNINAGSNPNGYLFSASSTYAVSSLLGGISTAAGGNVNLSAGGNVTSFLPTATSSSVSDAGSGAFGPEPGVVSVTAGGNIVGHFVAADSTLNGNPVASTITAGGNVGTSSSPLALSLVDGGWEVNAPNGSIYLQEVRNPNGALNGKSGGRAPFRHLFDYAPNSFVDLDAGDAVFLEGTSLPRYSTGDEVPPIYPPSLTINAGAGGVTLGNNVTLFPSPNGQLTINTTAGGSLEGAGFELAMSDSSASQWTGATDFASQHAAVPVHLNDPQPVVLNIAGNMDDITIVMPKETQITVGGNMNNTSFAGQNLHATDNTFIKVAGNIFNQNVYSFATVGGGGLSLPPALFPGQASDYLTLLENAVVPGSGPTSTGGGLLFPSLSLFYLPATQQLGYYGRMDQATEQLLLGTLQEKTYTASGQLVLDANGNYVTQPATFGGSSAAARTAVTAAIQALYAASQNSADPSSAPLGFQIGGLGQFNITANSLDLGVAAGIISEGAFKNPALAALGGGADINLTLQGDLTLFSSEISSYDGGAINIFAGGAIDAGLGSLPFSPPDTPYGIWTSGHSDVHVVAEGNVEVNGSRIAAFNGGNVFVESLDGNVDAGSGGSGQISFNTVQVNPVTHAASTGVEYFIGSGILTSTFYNSPASEAVGNITVLTPRGDINASQGGIAQDPLNRNASLVPTITLTAGTRGPNNSIIYPGNINASGSGVIGINVDLNAAGNVTGFVLAQGNSTISAAANVSGTFLSGLTASFSAGQSISGVAIAGVGINVGSGKFEGVALSQSVSGGGAQTALATSATASANSQTAAAQGADVQKAQTSDQQPSDDDDKKKLLAKRPALVKYTGRVTVLLPPKAR